MYYYQYLILLRRERLVLKAITNHQQVAMLRHRIKLLRIGLNSITTPQGEIIILIPVRQEGLIHIDINQKDHEKDIAVTFVNNPYTHHCQCGLVESFYLESFQQDQYT